MNYTEAGNYIDERYKKGSVFGLEPIRALMEELGNPQLDLKIIHIAGTNGKGSTGAFTAEVLKRSGYKVGRFVSPTIYCYEERFQINGSYITNDSFARFMTEVVRAEAAIDYEPTGFELETAVAMCYFKAEKCDIVLVECGLGGSMDATNVIDNNYLTVLTSISLDHTAVLGDTIEKIAEEKCGIIKEGTYVVSIEQKDEAESVIKRTCDKVGVGYSFARLSNIVNKSFNGLHQSFDYGDYKNIELSMLGDYQLENAALALECIKALKARGFAVEDKAVYDGMRAAHWGGRFEVIHQKPTMIIDGAHNPDAAVRLKNSLEQYFKGKSLLFIIGVFADKDYDGILRVTAPLAKKIFAVKAPSPRGLDTPELVKAIKKYNENAEEADLYSAIDYCLGQEDCITVAFGSLSFMGDVTRYVRELERDEI